MTDTPSDKFAFQMLFYYSNQMPNLPADKFTQKQLDLIRGVILICEFYAKEESEKRLLKKACFWWNQLAEFWNGKDKGEKLELIELKKEVVKEVTALTIRSKLSLTTSDKKYLRSLRIKWDENEDEIDDEFDWA